jgi:hypothetical protein
MQKYLTEKVIVERTYGGGSWRHRQRWLWGGYGCEFTELEGTSADVHTQAAAEKAAQQASEQPAASHMQSWKQQMQTT